MPRDANGNYTLPAGNPVVSGTPITSEWANDTMADVRDALTNSLSRNGQGGMLAPLRFFDGAVDAPGIGFVNQPSTGLYLNGVGDMRMTVTATDVLRVQQSKVEVWDDIAQTWGRLLQENPPVGVNQKITSGAVDDTPLTLSIKDPQTGAPNTADYGWLKFDYDPGVEVPYRFGFYRAENNGWPVLELGKAKLGGGALYLNTQWGGVVITPEGSPHSVAKFEGEQTGTSGAAYFAATSNVDGSDKNVICYASCNETSADFRVYGRNGADFSVAPPADSSVITRARGDARYAELASVNYLTGDNTFIGLPIIRANKPRLSLGNGGTSIVGYGKRTARNIDQVHEWTIFDPNRGYKVWVYYNATTGFKYGGANLNWGSGTISFTIVNVTSTTYDLQLTNSTGSTLYVNATLLVHERVS